MRALRWLIGLLILAGIITWIVVQPFGFLMRCLYITLLSGFLCLYRILAGPTHRRPVGRH